MWIFYTFTNITKQQQNVKRRTECLCDGFYTSARKKDGTHYESSSMKPIRAAIDRSLLSPPHKKTKTKNKWMKKEHYQTIIPFALVGYEIGNSQLSPTRLVGYFPSGIQRGLLELLLNSHFRPQWYYQLLGFFIFCFCSLFFSKTGTVRALCG